MSRTNLSRSRTDFLDGFKQAAPIVPAIAVFGMLFGATAVNSGLTAFEALLASATIHAGASQFVFLELFGFKAPVWSILLAVFAVNFRHLLYSASLSRHMSAFVGPIKYIAFFWLSDPQFGASEQRAERQGLSIAFYFGFASFGYPCWLTGSLIGTLFGALINDPRALGLDMLLAIYFVTLLMGFRSRPNWLPVVLASGVASAILFKYLGPPWHISLGAGVGIVLAAFLGKPVKKEEADA